MIGPIYLRFAEDLAHPERCNPKEIGFYAVYVDGPVVEWAAQKVLYWDVDRWLYPFTAREFREPFYGWAGPLPALKIRESEA